MVLVGKAPGAGRLEMYSIAADILVNDVVYIVWLVVLRSW